VSHQHLRRRSPSKIEEQASAAARPAISPGLSPESLLALQRSAGNGAVGRLLRQATPGRAPQPVTSRLLQRTPDENLQVLQGIPGAAADGSYSTEGSKGSDIKTWAEGDFIVTGKSGTWHHIYPRNLLKTHLENISKYLVHTKGKEGQMTSTTGSHSAMVTMAGSFSMTDSGQLAKPARYYWKNGNGYVGVRSDNRSDDPGSLVEHEKPASMSQDKYDLPRTWGKEIERLSNQIGRLNSLSTTNELESVDNNLYKMATNVMSMSWQLEGTPYRSVDSREGKDWKRTSTAHAWGDDEKNYELVK
jgi:hypothetical protein